MPKQGLRLSDEEYNEVVQRLYQAKERKDFQARTRLRAVLLIH